MATITYKCPNCGGDLQFDPTTQKFKCEFCLSTFTKEELDKLNPDLARDETVTAEAQPVAEDDQPEQSKKEGGSVIYTCPSCGAEIVTDETTAATFCYYCHNPVVLAGKLDDEFKPDYVIPFALDKKKATEIFKQWIGQKKYVPKAFFSESQIEKISGVYFPYWLYNCQVKGKLDADATKHRIWTTGDIRFTETSHFQVNREGDMGVQNVERNALKKANRQLVEGVLPFEMKALAPFHTAYLSGFMAEKRDMEKKEFEAEIENEIKEYASASLDSSVSGYDAVQVKNRQIDISNAQWKYALFPVWTLTYKDPQNGKIYYFACNGQSGKICGELPVDNGKLLQLFLTIFLPILIVLLIVGYFI